MRQYLNNTLAAIKVKQDTILADYAENCRADVQSCLATNGYDESNPNTTISKTAVNSCSAEITTCMSVAGYQVSDGVRLTLRMMSDWVAGLLLNCPVNTYLADNGIGNTSVHCQACGYPTVVYYEQSAGCALQLLNGNNSITSSPATSSGGQVTHCNCPSGYTDYVLNGTEDLGDAGTLVCIDITASNGCTIP